MTATSFVLPEARCAFMKTRRLAMAEERGRPVEARWAQACGFVSRTIARREGGGAGLQCQYMTLCFAGTYILTVICQYLAVCAINGVHGGGREVLLLPFGR